MKVVSGDLEIASTVVDGGADAPLTQKAIEKSLSCPVPSGDAAADK